MARKKATNTFGLLILILLVAGLAGFGATNFGGSVRTVATVGDVDIEVDDYARALEGQLRNFQRLTGQPMTFTQARALGFDRAALAQVVGTAAMRDFTDHAGLSVGDANVSKEITAMPAFQGLGGFDRQTYEQTLRQNGIDVRDFEDQVRASLTAGIVEIAVKQGVAAPKVFADTLFAFVREERDVTWARLTGDDLASPLPEPSEDELRAFHGANPEPFTEGETRVIRYAWLTPDMIVDQIDVDEDQIRALYDARLDEFVQPERRLVERLVFASQADADAAKTRLDSSEATFDDLVAERGLDLDAVDLGEVTPADLGAAADAVFAMTEPGVAGPLTSTLGPALFRVNAILTAHETPYEDVRDELAAEAAADRARRVIADRIAQVEDLLAGGASIDQLAERTDMEAGTIDWRQDVFDGIAGYEAFRDAAATAEEGAVPEVVELDDGGIFVLSLEEIRPPRLKDFDEVRDEVVAAWELAETGKALTAQAEALAERLRGGAEMAGLGLKLATDRALERSGVVDGTPPEFTDTVFDMARDEIRVLSSDGEAWIVRLDAIRAPDASTTEAQALLIRFGQETADELSRELLEAFTQSLIDAAGVSVNQSALNAVHAQLP